MILDLLRKIQFKRDFSNSSKMFKEALSIDKFLANPQRLFLLDGFGALISAFMLGVVLMRLESIFGIPRRTIYVLAFLPCIFALFDAFAYLRVKENIAQFLKAIAYPNLMYCGLSIALAFYHFKTITLFGWAYIIGEILIILFIVNLELKTAAQLQSEK